MRDETYNDQYGWKHTASLTLPNENQSVKNFRKKTKHTYKQYLHSKTAVINLMTIQYE